MERIIKNSIRCKHCGDIIESKSVHDFKWCSCKKVAVDGGHEYLRRCFAKSPEEDYEELSETVEVSDEEYYREIEERQVQLRKQLEELDDFVRISELKGKQKKNV